MKLVSLLAGSCGGTGANRTKKKEEDETPCEQMGWSSVILLKNKKSSCIQPEERGVVPVLKDTHFALCHGRLVLNREEEEEEEEEEGSWSPFCRRQSRDPSCFFFFPHEKKTQSSFYSVHLLFVIPVFKNEK